MIDSPRTSPGGGERLVSVVIPCYNGSACVPDAIRSVLAQTYPRLEVIVVDDGSSDGSPDVVRSIDDSRVRLVEHDANRGIAAARNTGVDQARGEYVAFLDQDDTWYPRKLEKQVEILDRDASGGIGLVFTAREIVRDGKRYRPSRDLRFPRPIEKASRRDVLAAFLERNFVWLISALVRRRCFDDVGYFSEDIRSGVDDLEFCVRLAMKYRLAYVDEVLVTRREHGENYTDPTRMLADDLEVADRIVRFDPTLDALRMKRRSELYFRCGRWWHDRGERERAREAYREALGARRGNVKAVGALSLIALGPVGDGLVRLYNLTRHGRAGGS
jgi:glycosyltransferase involved in cell wall biosynthesis